jgi:glutamyl-tRNA synthetase
MGGDALAPLVEVHLKQRGISSDARLPRLCDLLKDRCDTTVALADWVAHFYVDVQPDADTLAQHVTEAVKPALQLLAAKLADCAWDKASIAAAIKEVLAASAMKMPQLAMPVRVLLLGTPQTPSLDAVIELLEKQKVIAKLVGA